MRNWLIRRDENSREYRNSRYAEQPLPAGDRVTKEDQTQSIHSEIWTSMDKVRLWLSGWKRNPCGSAFSTLVQNYSGCHSQWNQLTKETIKYKDITEDSTLLLFKDHMIVYIDNPRRIQKWSKIISEFNYVTSYMCKILTKINIISLSK